jgi:hypothetical protein
LYVALRDIDPAELHDPFMQETIKRVPARETLIEITKTELGELAQESAPAGIVFHVARCGSTLVSKMLKQHTGLVVYSEPLPLNEILLPPHKWARADLAAALRALGHLMRRHAGRPYVMKLTSWNTLFCDLVAEAFPETPWALCVRDPLEVCVSLMQSTPGWLRNATQAGHPFAPQVDPKRQSQTQEDYVARLFAAFCVAADRLDRKRGLLLAYDTLPDAVWRSLAPHFGVTITDAVKDKMALASGAYSKAPIASARIFVPDDAAKRAAASPALRAAVDGLARPAFERLVARYRQAP